MTADPRVRFTHGLYVIAVCFFFFTVLTILKINLLKKMDYSTTDYSKYSKQRDFY
jgi:hypothetical protein